MAGQSGSFSVRKVRIFIHKMKETHMPEAENARALDRLLLCRADLRRRGIKISDSTIARLEAAGKFPKRVRLSTNSVAWMASEIDAYIAELAAAREAGR